MGFYFCHETHPQWSVISALAQFLQFFLELLTAVHSSPVAYWTPSALGDSSFRVVSFCLFIQFMRFSQQVFWGGLPFPPPVDHILSQLSTMACLSWVALHSMVHSFTELHKPLRHNTAVIHGRFQTHT